MIPLQAANLNLRGKKQTKTKNKRVIFRDFSEPVTQSPDLSTQSHVTSFLDERRTIYSVNAFPSWFMRVPSNQILYLFTYFLKKEVFILFFFPWRSASVERIRFFFFSFLNARFEDFIRVCCFPTAFFSVILRHYGTNSHWNVIPRSWRFCTAMVSKLWNISNKYTPYPINTPVLLCPEARLQDHGGPQDAAESALPSALCVLLSS